MYQRKKVESINSLKYKVVGIYIIQILLALNFFFYITTMVHDFNDMLHFIKNSML